MRTEIMYIHVSTPGSGYIHTYIHVSTAGSGRAKDKAELIQELAKLQDGLAKLKQVRVLKRVYMHRSMCVCIHTNMHASTGKAARRPREIEAGTCVEACIYAQMFVYVHTYMHA